jgi:integrase/recombinase XerD
MKHLFSRILRAIFRRRQKRARPHLAKKLKVKSEAFDAGEAWGEEVEATTLATTSDSEWLKGTLMGEIQRFTQTQRSQHTRRAYLNDIKQFTGFLRANGGRPDLDLLLAYRDWLTNPKHQGGLELGRATANRKFATIRSFLGWLQARGLMKDNPGVWLKNFRAQNESPTQAFSDEEVSRVLASTNPKTRSGLMHSLILHMLFYLGLRRGELVALKASHIGRSRMGDEMVLTLRVPGKGDKERVLPLPAKIVDLLEKYMLREGLEIGEERYLFRPVRNNITKVKEKPIDGFAIYYIVRKYARLAGVESKVSPHSCRATCISNALDHSASHRAVQDLAGWSSPLMIARYDKRRTSLQHSAVHTVDYK